MAGAALTVLMATRNGSQVLPRTLEGYRRIVAPPVPWKMVIVNNGSTDATNQMVSSFQNSLPITLLQQPVSGKNRALNTGISAVEGKLIVVTDDDAIPDPGFLAAWSKILNDNHGCGLFGGSIEPLFDAQPPKWVLNSPHHLAMMFAWRDLREGPIGADEIYGPNMAIDAAVLTSGLRFDEELGPNGLDRDYPMGSETEFCRRVESTGVKCWSAHEPRVLHIVRTSQLKRAAWARRGYRVGRGRAYVMFKRGEIIGAPVPSMWDRVAFLSPLQKHRWMSLTARQLYRGFRDECIKRLCSPLEIRPLAPENEAPIPSNAGDLGS
jgi:glucosyl-dolichyl phosphate glucuronosyltransferase